MAETLTLLAIVGVVMTGVSIVLARLIPDEYDGLKPEPIRVRASDPR